VAVEQRHHPSRRSLQGRGNGRLPNLLLEREIAIGSQQLDPHDPVQRLDPPHIDRLAVTRSHVRRDAAGLVLGSSDQQQQIATVEQLVQPNGVTAIAQREPHIDRPTPLAHDDGTPGVVDGELRQRLHEAILEGGKPGNQGEQMITKKLRGGTGSAHGPGDEVGLRNHVPGDGVTLVRVAVEQLVARQALEHEA